MGKLSHICNDAGLVPAGSESDARQQLAALHHLYQHFGWTDLIYTHISARVPDGSGRYLIKPDELLMDEVTASRLVKTDINQTPTTGGSAPNLAGHLIHTAVLKARPEVNFIAHTHSRAGAAVSCMKRGLLPLSQHANIILPTVAYHDYMDVTVAEQECDALGRDLGSNYLMIMRNHGLLAVGRTVAECFYYLYYLEMACKIQVDVLASGEEPILASKETVEGLFRFGGAPQKYPPGVRGWPAAIRILQRKGANYQD
jgi:ribulose-5-phosphate 4-epimerase/fuculose-1-phosphate aldolase